MGKKREESKGAKIARVLIQEYDCKTAQDLQEALKDLMKDTLQEMLKAELDEHLEYEYGKSQKQ